MNALNRFRIVLLIAILAGAALHSVSYYSTTSDDAFISLRYARNLVEGHGLVFNPGQEPVEGFSNPLFVFLSAGFLFLGIPEIWAIKGMGFLAFLGSVALLALSRRVAAGREAQTHCFGLAGAALLAASPFAALWSMAGLETGLYAFLILLGVVAASGEVRSGRVRFTPIVMLLVTFCRPEGILIGFGVFVVQWCLCPARWSALRRWTVGWGVPFAALMAARLWYYGSWTPNTYNAKVDMATSTAAKACDYLGSFLTEGGFWLAIPAILAICVMTFRRSWEERLIFAVAVIAAQIVFLIVVGRDFMPGYRFLMPVYPLACALAGGLIVRIGLRLSDLTLRFGAAILVVGLCTGLFVFEADSLKSHKHRFWLLRNRPWTAYLFQTDLKGTWLEGHESTAAYLKRMAGPTDVLVLGPAGVIPYYSELHAIDLFGLTDKFIARLISRTSQDQSGQDTTSPAQDLRQYLFSHNPRWIMLDGHFRPDGVFLPRFGGGIMGVPEWSDYELVFTAVVYPAKWSAHGFSRVNALFERTARPANIREDG